MSDPANRRYSEREFALILRKASELQVDESAAGPGASGISLDEIKQIADEAGIDPALVARAAALIGDGDIAHEAGGLLGPSAYLRISSSVEGDLSEDHMRGLMELVRYEMAKPGTIHEVLGSVTWKSDNQESPMEVRITPREGRTTIEVLSSAQAAKAMSFLLGGTVGFMSFLITLALLDVPKAAVLLGGFVLGPLLGTLVARPIWKRLARKWRTEATDLLDKLRTEAERQALPPAPDPGAGGAAPDPSAGGAAPD